MTFEDAARQGAKEAGLPDEWVNIMVREADKLTGFGQEIIPVSLEKRCVNEARQRAAEFKVRVESRN